MAGRWPSRAARRAGRSGRRGRPGPVSAFRADPRVAPSTRPSRRQGIALVAVLLLVCGGVAVASFLVRPDRARTFDVVHGSVFLADQVAPVGIDLASGKPTLRLVGADKQVGTNDPARLSLTPVHDGTMLLDPYSGEFNMVDQTGFVIKHDDGGVVLAKRSDPTSAAAIASANDDTPGAAFIERTGRKGTDVFLVNERNVQTASLGGTVVKPRASRTIPEQAMTGPGTAASANRALWVLLGTGDRHEIRQFRLPHASGPGARLLTNSHGTVTGPATIESVPAAGNGNAIAVASSDTIRIFGSSGRHTVRLPAVSGLDTVLPVSDGQHRFVFLLHSPAGWSIVSVAPDGTDRRGPTAVHDVPSTARLAPPAESDGRTYTIDRTDGTIYWIADDGSAQLVRGAAHYPLATRAGKVAEAASFGDAYVIARGPRVLVDSPIHTQAVALFTDDSRRPMVIHKSAAVDVSASGGAEALTRNPNPTSKGTGRKGGTRSKATPGQPVNNHIDCRTATQKPHVPLLQPPVAGSRSIALGWTYPLLDAQDCAPTTYVVSVRTLSADAPSAPSSVTVQGQTGVDLTGLYPNTQYEIGVTAYLNGVGTGSTPIRVTTGPQGPAAPTNVQVSADANGNWHVSWSGCGAVSAGCVPVTTWQVVPSICDGRGLSATPTSLSVAADPSSRAQAPVTYPGGDALLGRGLTFLVQGTGADGQVGTPSARSGCVYSHSSPVSGAMGLTASNPGDVELGGSASTNVTLNLGDDPVRDVGGVGAQITFHLTGDGNSYTRGPFGYDGGSSTVSTNFGGIHAGASYTASATVSAPQGGPSVTLLAPGIGTRANWPSTSLSASCPSDGALTLACTLKVTIGGISSSVANGESFDFHGQIQCGNTGHSIDDTDFDPGNHTITVQGLSQLNGYTGSCTVNGTLTEHKAGGNAVFGGTATTPSSTTVNLGSPPPANPDFSGAWDSTSATAHLRYTGSNPLFGTLTNDDFKEQVLAPDGSDCGDATQKITPSSGADVNVTQDCVGRYGNQTTGWTATISYTEKVSGKNQTATVNLDGAPPGYQPCDPGTFTAGWGDTQADGVTVNYTGDTSQLAACSSFDYVLDDASGNDCGHANNVDPTQAVTLQPTCTPTDGMTVVITWHNDDTNKDADPVTLPLGSPPSS